MRFKIGDGRVYDVTGIDRLSLANILRLEKETSELGRAMKWSELRAMVDRVADLDEEARDVDDDTPWVLALTVWASRLNAGDAITFEQAIDFPLGDFQQLPDPQDHMPTVDPTKARPGSGRAGSRSGGGKARKRTSGARSNGA